MIIRGLVAFQRIDLGMLRSCLTVFVADETQGVPRGSWSILGLP